MEIKTNNQPRDLLTWFDLSEKEQKEFDWIDNPEEGCGEFFRYKGNIYCLEEFMRTWEIEELKGWEGYRSDTYFSGVVIKRASDEWENGVIVGMYFS